MNFNSMSTVKKISLTTLFAALVVASTHSVTAQQVCTDAYGVTIPCPTEGINLSLVKTVDQSEATLGSTVVFTITIKNVGPEHVNEAIMKDFMPAQFEVVDGATELTITDLAVGEEVAYTITAKVKEDAVALNETKTVTNLATVEYQGEEEDRDDEDVVIKGPQVLAGESLPATSTGYEVAGMLAGFSIALGASLKALSEKVIK